MKRKITSELAHRKTRPLSKVGKAVLIKSSLTNISMFFNDGIHFPKYMTRKLLLHTKFLLKKQQGTVPQCWPVLIVYSKKIVLKTTRVHIPQCDMLG